MLLIDFLCILLSFQIIGDYYHFHHNKIRKRSVNPSHYYQRRLDSDDRVRWSKQQRIKSRQKRDFISYRDPRGTPTGKNRVLTSDPKWPQMWYLVSMKHFSDVFAQFE